MMQASILILNIMFVWPFKFIRWIFVKSVTQGITLISAIMNTTKSMRNMTRRMKNGIRFVFVRCTSDGGRWLY